MKPDWDERNWARDRRKEPIEDICQCTCGERSDPLCPCRDEDCACKRHWDGRTQTVEPSR